ncbi:MAG: site-specific integrase, partial [Desulfobacteraceae bacterium]|nr:site-specific integrase [Desulfobacteraceae bacterium]
MGVRVRQKIKGKGNPWWVFISHNGKRTSRKVGDKKATETVASTIRAKLQLGEFGFEDKKPVPTFKDHAKLWLALPHDWKESTRESYLNNLNKHILPDFGKMPVNEIKRKDLKFFFDKKYTEGLNLNTIKLIRAPINGILTYAVELELIESNPMRDLTLKYKKKKFELDPLTESESQLLLEQAQIFMNGDYYPPILCALRTGMRIGEIQALKWTDIDFDNRQIEVKRSYRRGRMTGTKNHKRRRVDLTLHLTETLKEHWTAQKRNALRNGKPVSEFVFSGVRDELLNRSSFKNALNRCTDKAGLRQVRTHNLRHSYATIRLMKGHNVGDVSYQLGHSSIKITYDVYAHWMPG